MKKKILTLTLAFALMLSMSGPAAANVGEDSTSGAASVVAFLPGSVPAETALAESMFAPLNALVMCMVEQDVRYDENDAVFLWNSLYYMLSLYGQMDDRAELTDDMLILPTETLQDYAAALFGSYSGLPALPEAMKDRVHYNAADDTYSLARGDAGLSEIRFDRMEQSGNYMMVYGSMVALEDESVLCTFRAELSPNESMFGYAICGLDIL